MKILTFQIMQSPFMLLCWNLLRSHLHGVFTDRCWLSVDLRINLIVPRLLEGTSRLCGGGKYYSLALLVCLFACLLICFLFSFLSGEQQRVHCYYTGLSAGNVCLLCKWSCDQSRFNVCSKWRLPCSTQTLMGSLSILIYLKSVHLPRLMWRSLLTFFDGGPEVTRRRKELGEKEN